MKNLIKQILKKPEVPSIVSQIKALSQPLARTSFWVVAPIAAFVPASVFALTWALFYDETTPVAYDFSAAWETNKLLCIMIAGGFAFSAKSVYLWGLSAFGADRLKAIGYCLIVEGTLIASPYLWLKITAGTYLVVINMLASGSLQASLAAKEQEEEDEEKKKEEDLVVIKPAATVADIAPIEDADEEVKDDEIEPYEEFDENLDLVPILPDDEEEVVPFIDLETLRPKKNKKSYGRTEVVKLAQDGLNPSKIAKQTNLSTSVVNKILIENENENETR